MPTPPRGRGERAGAGRLIPVTPFGPLHSSWIDARTSNLCSGAFGIDLGRTQGAQLAAFGVGGAGKGRVLQDRDTANDGMSHSRWWWQAVRGVSKRGLPKVK